MKTHVLYLVISFFACQSLAMEQTPQGAAALKSMRKSQLLALSQIVVTKETKNSLKDIISPRPAEEVTLKVHKAPTSRERADSWSEDPGTSKKYVI